MNSIKMDKILEKISNKLAQMTKTKNASQQSEQVRNYESEPQEKLVILIDDMCSSDFDTKIKDSNNIERGESSNKNVKEKDNFNKDTVEIEEKTSGESRNNVQTPSKNESPPSNPEHNAEALKLSKPIPQKSSNQKNLNIQPMPKVSSMNNLIKLSLKLPSSTILSEIKTRGFIEKISPIRYLLYFCVEKIMYTLWRNNGLTVMNKKLKNPTAERKFICEEILKGFIELITYFNNLERSFISKIIMTVFNRLGLYGIFNETWIPSCVQANLSLFQKIKANTEELLSVPKTKNITSNIFINVPHSETLKNYDNLELDLEDEDQTHERIDEVDKKNYSNKLFFFKNNTNDNKLPHKTDIEEHKNRNKITSNIPAEIPIQVSEEKIHHEKVIKEDLNMKNLEDSKFKIFLCKEKIPENTKFYDEECDSKVHSTTKQRNENVSSEEIPQYEYDEEVISQKRSREEPINFVATEECDFLKQNSGYFHASRNEIKEMIEEHLFNSFNEIMEKVMKNFKIKPEEVKEVLKSTALNKINSRKVTNGLSFQEINKVRAEGKPKKINVDLVPLQDTIKKPKKFSPQVEIQKKINTIPLTEKEIMALVEKTSMNLVKQGCSQKEIINHLFQILEENNVKYEKKQEILESWFERKEFRERT